MGGRNDAAIVEDDYDSEFRYDGRPIEPLQTLDTSGRVIYVGSFSKTMLATLRLGFVVPPRSLSPALRAAVRQRLAHVDPPQAALAHFIEADGWRGHLRRMRGVYQERHEMIAPRPRPRRRPDHRSLGRGPPCERDRHHRVAGRDQGSRAACAGRRGGRAAASPMFRVHQAARSGLALGYGAIDTGLIGRGAAPTPRRLPPRLIHRPVTPAGPARGGCG